MRIIKYRTMTTQTGASLIEILVTVIISMIGLLGLAALQNTSLKMSYDSYVRSQANFIAYDLIDRIRANPEAGAGAYVMDDDAALTQTDCYAGDSCTVSELREFDLYHWRQQARELLPDANVRVTFNAAQQLYSMTINWDDRVDNDVQTDEQKEFVYHFQIQ